MAVSKRLRYEILRRDNHTCRYCGGSAPDVKLTVDHVVPVALGGSDEAANLVAACADCNAGKTSINPDAPIVDDVAQDALRWSRAMRIAADRAQARRERLRDHAQSFAVVWGDYDNGVEYTIEQGDWEASDGKTYPWAVLRNGHPVVTCGDESDADSIRYDKQCEAEAPLPEDWIHSLERWISGGLTMGDLYRLVDYAMTNRKVAWEDKWRYLAGSCWSALRERADEARRIIEDGEA